ncbi:hypothetical protein [Streptomyces sp. NPDC088725]|uniref:hypothetical protein n=1 Tax=Streptomyces sp. NPDC088725 TaxID=3365873 RepID=UPI003804D3AD
MPRTRSVAGSGSWIGAPTDNVTAHLLRGRGRFVITLRFRRGEHLTKHPRGAGQDFVAEMPAVDFVGLFDDLAAVLDGDQNQGRP